MTVVWMVDGAEDETLLNDLELRASRNYESANMKKTIAGKKNMKKIIAMKQGKDASQKNSNELVSAYQVDEDWNKKSKVAREEMKICKSLNKLIAEELKKSEAANTNTDVDEGKSFLETKSRGLLSLNRRYWQKFKFDLKNAGTYIPDKTNNQDLPMLSRTGKIGGFKSDLKNAGIYIADKTNNQYLSMLLSRTGKIGGFSMQKDIKKIIKSSRKKREKKKQIMKAVIVEEQKTLIKEETKKPETFNHLNPHQKTLLDQYQSSNNNPIVSITKYTEERNAHVIKKKKTFGNFGASFCLYEEIEQEYQSKGCDSKLRDSKSDEKEKCISLWQQLGNDQAASLRPVDPSQGTCGIPNHLDMYGQKDMYGKKITSGMEFQMDDKLDENKPIKIKITSSAEVKDEITNKLKTWVNGIKKRNEIHVKNGKVVWNGVIPKHIGKIIRDNCETLKWSVKMGGTIVDFNGLTFTLGGKSRRRRVLQESASAC
jgi:hypothetical protein